MGKTTDRRNVRYAISQAFRSLRKARGIRRIDLCQELDRIGFSPKGEAPIRGLETGSRVPTWRELIALLQALRCSLTGFGLACRGTIPEPAEGPPAAWADIRVGRAVERIRVRRLLTSRLLAKRMSAMVPMTEEKLLRWERGELQMTVPRLMLALDELGVDFDTLEGELGVLSGVRR